MQAIGLCIYSTGAHEKFIQARLSGQNPRRAGTKSHDARRWQSNLELNVSLDYLEAIFSYLAQNGIGMYRMSSDLAPYVTHPDLPQFHRMIRDSAGKLRETGALARQLDLRLSFHPSAISCS